MESDEVLSPDEKEAILDSAQADDVVEEPTLNDDEVELFDFVNANNTMAEYPAIQAINELFFIDFNKSFTNFIGQKATIKAKNLQLISFRRYLKQLDNTAVYNTLLLKSHNAFGLFILQGRLLHNCMTTLYGGTIEDKENVRSTLGKLDKKFAKKITDNIMQSLHNAWVDILPLDHEILQTTTNLSVLTKIDRDEIFFTAEYTINIDGHDCSFTLCIPRCLIESKKPTLIASHQQPLDQQEQIRWKKSLHDSVYDTQVGLTARFPEVNFKLNKLVRLKEGDIIPINNPQIVEVLCNDTKLFKASTGTANGNRVIKIIQKNTDI